MAMSRNDLFDGAAKDLDFSKALQRRDVRHEVEVVTQGVERQRQQTDVAENRHLVDRLRVAAVLASVVEKLFPS